MIPGRLIGKTIRISHKDQDRTACAGWWRYDSIDYITVDNHRELVLKSKLCQRCRQHFVLWDI